MVYARAQAPVDRLVSGDILRDLKYLVLADTEATRNTLPNFFVSAVNASRIRHTGRKVSINDGQNTSGTGRRGEDGQRARKTIAAIDNVQ